MRKNIKNPALKTLAKLMLIKKGTYQINNWKNNAIQNHAFATALAPSVTSGEIGPGPILFGANALAQIVAIDPRT